MPRRLLSLAVLTLTGLPLAACGGDESPGPHPPSLSSTPIDRTAGWREIDLDGEVRTMESGYDHLLAAGVRDDGKPLLVGVTDDIPDLTLKQPPAWDGAGLSAISLAGLNMMVSDGDAPSDRQPGRLWLADDFTSYDVPVVRDRDGRRPVWLAPLLDGEEDIRVLGAVPYDREWRLHAWELTEKWEFIDNGPQLYVDGPPSPDTLVSGTTEGSVLVAGRIANRPDVPAGPSQAWLIDSDPSYSGTRWQRLPLKPAPETLSDIAYWDVGFWIAGQRGLKPAVYDFDETNGRSMEVPDTTLDPARPKVFVANLPISQDGKLVLATQSEAGPTVWVQADDGWTELPAPPGSLESAQLVGQTVYLLIDGRIWWRALPDGLIEDPWETESASPSGSGSPAP